MRENIQALQQESATLGRIDRQLKHTQWGAKAIQTGAGTTVNYLSPGVGWFAKLFGGQAASQVGAAAGKRAYEAMPQRVHKKVDQYLDPQGAGFF